ncbi:fungal specific transcription factor domain-containing protein [Aspergillus aculeatinus CBS 121060]|uniref:Uncharacterized protein n=1 Tax=Aspergillus aculeatinus CBS 121060 TaxID=1448322 RepID=A0ACD1H943_9EURO|nr:hypothetical protein BO66DRAFT_471563 [Aspergillus aculeatinus CBS 121060]RAH69924.1 hypothetical protein BO66DRAFT_471563 [Aspergillus aculeatinus CBS 121060]
MTERVAFLRENWYDAALYFLHQADFLRLLDVRNIQTISILGTVFSNFGDLNLYYNLLGCAVRIGESLGINNDYTHHSGVLPDLESQRSLWWSLVILDWLNIPLGQPCIRENDFLVEMPFISETQSDWDSTNYQANMCKVALVLYRFQTAICASMDWETVENAVIVADEKLVNLKTELSSCTESGGLENTYVGTDTSDASDCIGSIQRRSLLLILFYYRILINRTLIHQTPSTRAKKVSLSRCSESAHNILKLCTDLGTKGHLMASWSMLLPLYSAANVLAVYGSRCRCEPGHDHMADVTTAVQIFDSLSHKSAFGEYAARRLKEIIDNAASG